MECRSVYIYEFDESNWVRGAVEYTRKEVGKGHLHGFQTVTSNRSHGNFSSVVAIVELLDGNVITLPLNLMRFADK